MKKYVLALTFLTTCSLFAQAQTGAVGFYIGPNFSNFDVRSPNLEALEHSGYQFGGYYRKGGFLYGQGGIEFQHLKTEMVTDTSAGLVNMKRIQLPIYAGINLLNFTKSVLNVRVFAGPVIGYNYGYEIDNPDLTSSDFSRFNVNGAMGGGVDLLIFSLDAGYLFGFSNLFSEGFDAKGNYAFLNVGVKF